MADAGAKSGPEPRPKKPAAAADAGAGDSDLLRPTAPAQRTGTAWEFASLWIGLVVGVPSYYIAGSLVEEGMSWWQGVAVVVAAKLVLLFPLIAMGHLGARHGLPFPVLARAAFGVRGAHLPALLRALVACAWFGIETWIGGQALALLLPDSLRRSSSSASSDPLTSPIPFLAASPIELLTFFLFWLLQLALLFKGMRGIRALEKYSAPVLVVLAGLLLSWAYVKAGGFGPMLSLPPRLSPSEFWELFFPSLTANVGSWAAVALSIPDFTRYARSTGDQALGQLGLPLFMGAFAFVGVAVTSATVTVFGHAISNPIDLLAAIGGGATCRLLAVPGIALAIVTTNIPANVVAPANALANLGPAAFGFKTGALATAVAGAAVQPWRIFRSADSFVYTWLVGYSAVMGPIQGVVLADYYVLRRMELDVAALYDGGRGGSYYYCGGWNPAAVAAMAASLAPVVPGFLHKVGLVGSIPGAFVFIYNVGWFLGFFLSGFLYWLLSLCFRSGVKGKARKASSSLPSLTGPLLPVLKGSQ